MPQINDGYKRVVHVGKNANSKYPGTNDFITVTGKSLGVQWSTCRKAEGGGGGGGRGGGNGMNGLQHAFITRTIHGTKEGAMSMANLGLEAGLAGSITAGLGLAIDGTAIGGLVGWLGAGLVAGSTVLTAGTILLVAGALIFVTSVAYGTFTNTTTVQWVEFTRPCRPGGAGHFPAKG